MIPKKIHAAVPTDQCIVNYLKSFFQWLAPLNKQNIDLKEVLLLKLKNVDQVFGVKKKAKYILFVCRILHLK